jgi:hypothetical protein
MRKKVRASGSNRIRILRAKAAESKLSKTDNKVRAQRAKGPDAGASSREGIAGLKVSSRLDSSRMNKSVASHRTSRVRKAMDASNRIAKGSKEVEASNRASRTDKQARETSKVDKAGKEAKAIARPDRALKDRDACAAAIRVRMTSSGAVRVACVIRNPAVLMAVVVA